MICPLIHRFIGLLGHNLKIKLLIETKPIVCLPWEILHYKISRENFNQNRDSNLGPPDF